MHKILYNSNPIQAGLSLSRFETEDQRIRSPILAAYDRVSSQSRIIRFVNREPSLRVINQHISTYSLSYPANSNTANPSHSAPREPTGYCRPPVPSYSRSTPVALSDLAHTGHNSWDKCRVPHRPVGSRPRPKMPAELPGSILCWLLIW